MARPKKGTEKGDLASSRWWETMKARYGGEAGVRKMMSEMGHKGGALSTSGGFASEKVGKDGLTGKERSRISGAKGGKIGGRISSRKGVRTGEGKKWRVKDE